MKALTASIRETVPLSGGFSGITQGRAALIFLFLIFMGLAIRLSFIGSAGVVHDRQFRSLLIARAMYFAEEESVAGWRKNVAQTSSDRQEILEPPVMEYVVASGYRLIGGESRVTAQIVPLLLWVLGAIPLFLIAQRCSSLDGALYSVAYYLFVPSGVHLSVSFLPEPLMLTMLLFSLLAILRYSEQQSRARLLVAAATSALTIVVKPFVAPVILGTFVSLEFDKKKGLKQFLRKPFVAFFLIAFLPGLFYYGHGLVVESYLQWKIESSFLPHLLWSPYFWLGWLRTSAETTGAVPMLLGLFGLVLVKGERSQRMLLGFLAGYAAFCLAFNYYTRFLTYYHAQLIILVALALGPALSAMLEPIFRARRRSFAIGVVLFSVLLGLALNYYYVKKSEIDLVFEGVETAEAVGRAVNHSDRVAYLARHYGLPLEYFGELAGEAWPRALRGWPLVSGHEKPRSVEERISSLGFEPEYFVITNLREYARHHEDLAVFLAAHAELVAESDEYLVFELHTAPAGPEGPGQ